MSDLVEIGAVWQNTTKNNETYFKGKLGNADLIILKNTHKTLDKHPDYRVMVAKPKKKEDKPQSQAPAQQGFDSDSIPF